MLDKAEVAKEDNGLGKYFGHGYTVTSKHVNKILMGPIFCPMQTFFCLILGSGRKKSPAR